MSQEVFVINRWFRVQAPPAVCELGAWLSDIQKALEEHSHESSLYNFNNYVTMYININTNLELDMGLQNKGWQESGL